jgi:hypothetical protein
MARASVVEPGTVDTELANHLTPDVQAGSVRKQPVRSDNAFYFSERAVASLRSPLITGAEAGRPRSASVPVKGTWG